MRVARIEGQVQTLWRLVLVLMIVNAVVWAALFIALVTRS